MSNATKLISGILLITVLRRRLGNNQPDGLIALLWIGMVLLACSGITLGIGLIVARS